MSTVRLMGLLVVAALASSLTAGAAHATRDAGLKGRTFKVVLSEWSLGFNRINVKKELSVRVVNRGRYPHNLVVQAKGGGKVYYKTPLLKRNQKAAFRLNLPPGQYDLYCSVPRHRSAGMQAALNVGG